MQTSGRRDVYEGIWRLEKLIRKFPAGSDDRKEGEEILRQLRRGQYMNEEQLKSMYRWGWREGEWLTWLPDDFDEY
jgi:hypothetical protein